MKVEDFFKFSVASEASELSYFRMILGAAALVYLLFGFIYSAYIPGEIPMSLSHRLAAAGFFLAILISTYLFRWAKDNVTLLMYAAVSVAVGHLVYFSHLAGYSLNYLLSILVVIILINFLFRGNIKLKWLNVAIALGIGVSVFLSLGLSIEAVGYIGSVVTISSVSFVLSRSKQMAQEEYEQLFEDSPIGLIQCGSDGTVLNFNREMYRLAGKPEEGKLRGLNIFDLLDIESEELSPVENKEKLLSFPWGREVPVEFSVELIPRGEKNPRDIIIACMDITERKEVESRIEYITYHDNLTDLYNRSFFQQKSDSFNNEESYPFSVVFIDLDKLKLVNDAFGHQVGDRLLKKASEVVEQSCRDEDFVFRWGGDELVIFLPETSDDESRKISSRIRGNCEKTEFQPIDLSLSIGRASAEKYKEATDLKHLLKEAEENMYENKMNKQKKVSRNILARIEERIEEKAPCIIDHEKRVKDYSLKLGKTIGMENEQLERLGKAARYHDIGRVSLEEKLLNKDQKNMSEEEKNELQGHSNIGYQIAREIQGISEFAQPILQHHEWWNGEGYPQGKSGDDITLNSRVVAIANYYDFLSDSHCNFRQNIDKESALEMIEDRAGSQFDPEITKAFLAVFRQDTS